MKIYIQPPLKMLVLFIALILQFSCSKDSDLLADYVLADALDSKSIESIVVDDTYQVSLTGSMVLDVLANDTFESGAEVEITETSSPANGTVEINNDETLTYTPDAEIIEQVSDTTNTTTIDIVDTFTYTTEIVNEDGITTSEEASVVITTEDDSSRLNTVSNISPFDYCQDGNPIGGGTGYDAILSSSDATIHITSAPSAASFKTTVESAVSGDVIFIDSGITIDLTGIGSSSILVKQGLTIASDRGTNAGALIKTDDMSYNSSGTEIPTFKVTGPGVRFTGLRIQGPFGGFGVYEPTTQHRKKWGISSHYDNTEVDNCELYNWPSGAVAFSNFATVGFFGPNLWSDNQLYHHNYAHNNGQNQWGYGVVVGGSNVAIYANLFADNRHDIAGSGESSPNYSSYDAYCNTVLGDNISHNFDMHGAVKDGDCTNCSAGKLTYIHHNDFKDIGAKRGTTNKENIRIRGIPEQNVIVEYNRFSHPNFAAAFKQTNVTSPLQNVIESNNIYE